MVPLEIKQKDKGSVVPCPSVFTGRGVSPAVLGKGAGGFLFPAMPVQITQKMQLDIGVLSIYILTKKSYLKHRMFT